MKHSVPHALGKDLAKKAVLAAFSHYDAQFAKYDPKATWTSDDHADVSFTAKGITLRGGISVLPSSIDVELDVPFLLRPVKERALDKVEREIAAWVDKAKRGEI
jgi:hypothetical protein